MAVSVLVVDDSGFFRKRLTEVLNASDKIKVVGAARNGREGVELAEQLRPDVITMDYEMPVMDGITAVREIMKRRPVPVLMFSSLTYEGARVTLDALEAGAVDFLPKNFEEIAGNSSQLQKILIDRILDVARSRPGQRLAAAPRPVTPTPVAPVRPAVRAPRRETSAEAADAVPGTPVRTAARKVASRRYRAVGIGTSTGGPIALQRVLSGLPANFPAPLLLVQHMPASFTPAFAERLNKLCRIDVRQAEDGDLLEPGLALLAPGGKQMMVEQRGGRGRVRILSGDDRLNYKPSVDLTFGSLARSFPGETLGIVLTGMGADGREGCRLMKQSGSVVWSQDEQSSVIYGMPMAVAKAGLSDEVLSLEEFGPRLLDGVH
ncbi:protein-glutamate methylesterase/protein-glutamine glutaminase [Marinobacter sp. X15-166B]|uniref:protein-glutamate methylesterase/protein-glutamine glutaminase n=1 Tax=Marinobacter sp. X15-166B TaxID=1897620 RepID=UPI00085C1E74|nr:chemotaxis response regulator protein-glutamate methylesterase [Marinobacter sp. X15-166B]OEY67090.1 chemotaxis response regulator protein-glutamate methylesterase [Marinobacter sp. X15-166B]